MDGFDATVSTFGRGNDGHIGVFRPLINATEWACANASNTVWLAAHGPDGNSRSLLWRVILQNAPMSQ